MSYQVWKRRGRHKFISLCERSQSEKATDYMIPST